jgi:HAD superfamily hydrolase (TIGR01509 family)
VILFSNTNAIHGRHADPRMAELAGVERYLSCELGLVKPAPEAFLKVAELARIDPRRSLMIDDVPENVRGAREAGFQGLLFQGEAALREALLEAGVAAG